jgi:hypothetical protein
MLKNNINYILKLLYMDTNWLLAAISNMVAWLRSRVVAEY